MKYTLKLVYRFDEDTMKSVLDHYEVWCGDLFIGAFESEAEASETVGSLNRKCSADYAYLLNAEGLFYIKIYDGIDIAKQKDMRIDELTPSRYEVVCSYPTSEEFTSADDAFKAVMRKRAGKLGDNAADYVPASGAPGNP